MTSASTPFSSEHLKVLCMSALATSALFSKLQGVLERQTPIPKVIEKMSEKWLLLISDICPSLSFFLPGNLLSHSWSYPYTRGWRGENRKGRGREPEIVAALLFQVLSMYVVPAAFWAQEFEISQGTRARFCFRKEKESQNQLLPVLRKHLTAFLSFGSHQILVSLMKAR